MCGGKRKSDSASRGLHLELANFAARRNFNQPRGYLRYQRGHAAEHTTRQQYRELIATHGKTRNH